jgi:hypothetical protein
MPFGKGISFEEHKRSLESQAESHTQNQRQHDARAWEEWLQTPPGRARTAYARGDRVFQYDLDVLNQQPIIVPMVGSTTTQRITDASSVLNAVCNEGWDLVNGSFVFVEQGSQSRDKFMSSDQNVAVKGTTVGYYLFRRCEENVAPSHFPPST